MKKIILISTMAALLSGCSTANFTENVSIDSTPTGADVFVNSELVGQTPMEKEMSCDGNYDIRLAKKGYKDSTVHIASVRTKAPVKFGVLVDSGYYKELTPTPVDAKMVPDFLPADKGLDPFKSMTANMNHVDKMRKDGEISQEEHSYLVEQITEFYSK